MRTLIVAAAFATAAGPVLAQGQIQVGSKQRLPDSSVRIMLGPLQAQQLAAITERIAGLVARNKKLEAQLLRGVKDSSLTRTQSEALQDEIDRVFVELLATQRQLAIGCLQGAKSELVDGTLGLHVHDTVHVLRTVDAQGGTLTMIFKTTPIIESVDPGSPAERAGIQVGDVWLSANGRVLIDSVRFDEMMKPGSIVDARVLRAGKEIEVKGMTVAKKVTDSRPDACAHANLKDFTYFPSPFMDPRGGFIAVSPQKSTDRLALPSIPPGGKIQVLMYARALYGGAVMQPLDDDWRDLTGLQGEGLIITDLPDDSPAAIAGLKRFDLIKLVNGEPITTVMAFQKLANVQKTLVFTVYTKKTGTRTVTMANRR